MHVVSRKIAPINLVLGQEYGRVDTGGEREHRMNWEVTIDVYIYIYYHIQCSVMTYEEGNGSPLRYSCLENPKD